MRLSLHSVLQANTIKHLADANFGFAFLNSPSSETKHQVLLHGHVRPQRKILKHHSHITFLWWNVIFSGACDDSIFNLNLPFVGNLQSGNKTENGGLPRTRRSEEDEPLCLFNPKR